MGKWDALLQGIDPNLASTLLSNAAKSLSANAKNVNIAPFTKFAFPLIRQTAPQLISSQLVSVQPMTGPIGGIFYYKPRYGTPSNPMAVGDSVQTTRKINKKIITGVVQEIVVGHRRGHEIELAIVENASTGKKHRIDPIDLKKVTPLDVLATVT